MGDLDKDTTVTPAGDGRYTARLSEDWAIWGPNGGYVASVALRAAGLASGRARPVSLVGHMLSVARFDDVEVTASVLRRSRVATSVQVSLRQQDRPVLEALVWGVDEMEHQLAHDVTTAPDIAGPDALPSWLDVNPEAEDTGPVFPFWQNVETRGEFEPEPPEPPDGPLEPSARWWWRFRPVARFDDPWVDACRMLIPIDTMGWPAAHRAHAHRESLDVIAPTVDLSVRFHRPAPDGEDWVLCDTRSPLGAEGLIAATGQVWSIDGALLASGAQSMLCRPALPG